jgi:hypothetical protein
LCGELKQHCQMFWDYQGSVETDYFIGFGMHKFVVAELVIFFLKKREDMCF